MLNIYYGRESLDKEKFIFDSLDLSKKNLIIVPDQFSLEMEEDMFSYLNVTSLINTEVISFSKLGSEILMETGGNKRIFIDKYGRHMLLYEIAKEIKGELKTFSRVIEKPSFLNILNNLISELKQGDVSVSNLSDMLKSLSEDSDSYKKINDLKIIYERYIEKTKDKYLDSEDKIDLYISKIKESRKVKDANVYLYGFDSIPPKSLKILKEILEYAASLNVILTYDENDELFSLTKIVIENLVSICKEKNKEYIISKIDESYKVEKDKGIEILERSLFTGEESYNEGNVTLIKAGSISLEMESVSSHILELIRDKGYKPREIRVVLNDKDLREPILRRMCLEYNLDVFSNLNLAIMDTPIVQYVLALLETIVTNYKQESVMKVLKSGFSDLTFDECMTLETYIKKYKVRYNAFKKPFYKGESEYKEKLLEIENLRKKLIEPIVRFEEFKKVKSIKEFIDSLYIYLDQDASFKSKIEKSIEFSEENMRFDISEKTSQVFSLMIGVLEQIREIMGEEDFDIKGFLEMFKIGLQEIEVGLLPLSKDSITIDTIERQRMGRQVKAVIICGMNEGILPMNIKEEDILSNEERELLNKKGKEIFKTEKIAQMEEKLAIYRSICKGTHEVFLTCSTADEIGEKINESSIYKRVKEIFPNNEISGDDIKLDINDSVSSFRHLTNALCKIEDGKELDEEYKMLLDYLKINRSEDIEKLKEAFLVNNIIESIGKKNAKKLYSKTDNISLGPTSIEEYMKCPFKFYLNKGLKLKREEIYESKGADLGSFSHTVISKFSKELSKDKLEPMDERSKWQTIKDEEIKELVRRIIEEEIKIYREELFRFNKEEEYKIRRLGLLIEETCLNITRQVRAGLIKEMYFEEDFTREGKFKPITFDVGNDKIYIEGRIDRVDILNNNSIKIIDYKSGNDLFDEDKVRAGYQIQLILYLKSVEKEGLKPGAMLYFHIKEKNISFNSSKEATEENILNEVKKNFKMDGLIIGDDVTIDNMDKEMNNSSNIIPITKTKDGYKDTKYHISYEEFSDLEKDVLVKIEEGVRNLSSGDISISPLRIDKGKKGSACNNCEYKGICRFEEEIPGSIYRES